MRGRGGGNPAFSAKAKAIFSRRKALKKTISALTRSSAAAALLTAGAYFGAAGNAQAGMALTGGSCTIDSGAFASVTIGNMAHAPDITVPFNMTCNITEANAKTLAAQNRGVGYCFHIHNLLCSFAYRTATSYQYGGTPDFVTYGAAPAKPLFPYIEFNFYGLGGSKKIGSDCEDQRDQYNIIGWAHKISDTKYAINDSLTLRFENNLGRAIKPGDYANNSIKYNGYGIHGGITGTLLSTAVDWARPNPFCNDNDTVTGTNRGIGMATMMHVLPSISISVRTYCTMSVRNQATFPAYASLRDVKPITATLNVDCSAGTHYEVDSNLGLHAIGNQRYMKAQNSDTTIAYNIDSINSSSGTYTPDSAEPLRKWTDYGNGTPAGVNYDIQLSIPRQPTPPDDTYRDTIVYTLNHIPETGDITNLNNMAGYTVQ